MPSNCDSATVTVIVIAAPIDAVNDDLSSTPINGYVGGTAGNIFANNTNGPDTLNSATINPTQVLITVVNNGGLTGLTISNTGNIIVPNQTIAGTYVITYSICEVLNPSNCDQATITIVVTAPLVDAVDDLNNAPLSSSTGGSIPVYQNDTFNQNPINNPSDVVFTIADNGGVVGITIDGNGNIIIPPGTPIGVYTVTYSLCDALNLTDCDTAIVVVEVKDPCDFDDSSDDCDLNVYNYVSPGNDTINDYFQILGIEKYPNNSIEIFNRWGVLVFDAQGYDNTTNVFRGISEGRATVKQSQELPDGTYFYVLKYTKNSGIVKEKAGYLYISRK
jgi:gliding motility-associated-like protein